MAEHNIEIIITKTGEVKAHIKGAKGKGCLIYAKLLSEIVGKIKEQHLTTEYYEPDRKSRIDIEQRGGTS